MKIQVTGEVGREINPWDSYRKNQSAVGMCIERVEAEKHIQSYPAPGIEDGEHEAELVWQQSDEDGEGNIIWRRCYNPLLATSDTRQIWKLTPKAK